MSGFQLQNTSRRGGGGVRRVLSVASIANQPHVFENKYVAGSGVGATTISNRRAKMRRTFTLPVIIPSIQGLYIESNGYTNDFGYTLGEAIDKDMANDVNYTNRFDPFNYQSVFFSGMADFIDENIIAGDKTEETRLLSSRWYDWGPDIYDRWGFFYIYDVSSGKYYFPIFDPINQDDGIITTQVFNAFGRTFTIKHGFPVQGIWKFDITVSDNLPFIFGAYGDMGSDGEQIETALTQNYSKGANNLTLYYHKDEESGTNDGEILYSYWIPKKISENTSPTYNVFYENDDDMGIRTNVIHSGLLLYMSMTNDVKDWVINDLTVV